MRHAVILAGGAGTRLWPLSRKRRPKQLMRLFDGGSLLQLSRRRLTGLFAAECTWVITAAEHVELIRAELPDLPAANVVGEPLARNTANAIGLATELIARRDADATMAVFTADHLITPQAPFEQSIQSGLEAAERYADSLVTFGIPPTRAEPGYGYLRRGERVAEGVFRVAEFKEKPSAAVAQEYVSSGAYLWNSGMFVWRLAAIRAAIRRYLPESTGPLEQVAAAWDDAGDAAAAERRRLFGGLANISIDHGVMERAADVLLIPMPCHWLDLGSWTAIAETRTADADGNVMVAPRGMVVDGRNNVVVSEDEHLVVVLGASDLVVVRSADATLVCRREDVQRIRELAGLRVARFGEQYE